MGLYEVIKDSLFGKKDAKPTIAFIDTEVGVQDKKVHDIAAIVVNKQFHSSLQPEFAQFVADAEYICGHNIIHHDLEYLPKLEGKKNIDTLYLSPLLFPKRPYHKLLKDDKIDTEELNNPLNDCQKARDLFYDEVNAFEELDDNWKSVYCNLLYSQKEFCGFFDYLGIKPDDTNIDQLIKQLCDSKICIHSRVDLVADKYPVELAYTLALISTGDCFSVTPPWLMRNYSNIENVIKFLCNTPCHTEDCKYCNDKLDIHRGLKEIFGYEKFRLFEGEPMQEKAVQAAVDGKSLLTIFPTGGGKSLTFQLPAFLAGHAVHGLTVVISPLQSLMKDQVDNLAERGITEAVTINGLLDPITRANAIERVANGSATMLYISPEMLRSKTIEKLLASRNVVRFVIDEAHCFSAWGQDFRVDYLYIGDFIKKLQEKRGFKQPIPVSCFTATAKQKVITDIQDYFQRKLGLKLETIASSAARQNLRYSVIYAETDNEKYNLLRNLLLAEKCPSIVYVSRTKKTTDLATKLKKDGINALPFNGKMEANDKVQNQNAFISGDVDVMVATSAFGMGVDKDNVGLVIHYDISDSLENYVQEAGRAGRNPNMNAKCYVLYSDHDLDKHFILLNQTKISISEIQQVWSAVKVFTKQRPNVSCSALEIARQAGWDDEVSDIETRVRTAIAALEDAGYLSRGNNVPQVFATGIMVKNMDEARQRITHSKLFYDEKEQQNAIRIIKSLISQKNIYTATDGDAESRIDYLADILGLTKESVISSVNMMRQEGILADMFDMSAYIDYSVNKSKQILENFARLELFIIETIAESDIQFSYKIINEQAIAQDIPSSIKNIRTLLYFLTIKSYIKKKENRQIDYDGDRQSGVVQTILCQSKDEIVKKYNKRIDICRFVIDRLYKLVQAKPTEANGTKAPVTFSVVSLLNEYKQQNNNLFQQQEDTTIDEIEDALLYLSKIDAMKLEGGFMVLYNAMEIRRLKESRFQYKIDDYRLLNEFYKQKIQQIHIVGEYANLMVRDYAAALQYVHDYFQMDFKKFIVKYFKGERLEQIDKNITPQKYEQLFGDLSVRQREIIDDKQSRYIVVAAGPGSGKTRVLVRKLASLLMLEDVKHEQLLMLTFSRAAATEFKQRLIELIGNAVRFVEIKTFHSFSFDLLGRVGSLEDSKTVVRRATQMIENGEAEQGRINKAVLVIDEAQDMDANEFALVRALMRNNEEMRIVAVGDDDQNIYQFRGSDSRYMQAFITEMQAKKYELCENYRSLPAIVAFANNFAHRISNRMKTAECTSVYEDGGSVIITQHNSVNIEIPLVEQLVSEYHGERACVLTNTNDEAAQIVGMLTQRGIRAKLIQSADDFNFGNLAEIRAFLKNVDFFCPPQFPIISDNQWEKAKEKTLSDYATSSCIDYIKEFFNVFEHTNTKKYRSDLVEFISESNLEDFCGNDAQNIFVSTIHKAKGREFDSVYMLLKNEIADTDEKRRKLYVGITRAKQKLYIHCNTSIFNGCGQIATLLTDHTEYPTPERISLQLSLRGVYLDFKKNEKDYKKIKTQILKLRSGMALEFSDGKLLHKGQEIASLSSSCRDILKAWNEKGYSVESVTINFIVAWKKKEDTEETPVLLPEILLVKRK